MEHLSNPFNGNKVKISKKVTRKTFDERYAQEYRYDPEKDCDYNDFYMIATNGIDYILIREKAE